MAPGVSLCLSGCPRHCQHSVILILSEPMLSMAVTMANSLISTLWLCYKDKAREAGSTGQQPGEPGEPQLHSVAVCVAACVAVPCVCSLCRLLCLPNECQMSAMERE